MQPQEIFHCQGDQKKEYVAYHALMNPYKRIYMPHIISLMWSYFIHVIEHLIEHKCMNA